VVQMQAQAKHFSEAGGRPIDTLIS
jgi:hypothetical protein